MADESNGAEQEQQGGEGQGRLQGALPLVVTVAAAAAAGGIAVVARKALSGGGTGRSGDSDEEEREPTSFEDLDQVADDLTRLVDELGSAAAAEGERDYKRLVEIADAIGEYADQAANAFDAAASGSDEDDGSGGRVTDDLMRRVQGLTGNVRETADVREQVAEGSSRRE